MNLGNFLELIQNDYHYWVSRKLKKIIKGNINEFSIKDLKIFFDTVNDLEILSYDKCINCQKDLNFEDVIYEKNNPIRNRFCIKCNQENEDENK